MNSQTLNEGTSLALVPSGRESDPLAGRCFFFPVSRLRKTTSAAALSFAAQDGEKCPSILP